MTADPTARRARVAVTGWFVINGAFTSNVVPRLPEIKRTLGLTNAQLGVAIAGFPIGALVAGLLAGWLIARFGSARVATATCVIGAAGLCLFGLAGVWVALFGAYALLGMWTPSPTCR